MESLGTTFQDDFPSRIERLRSAGVLRYDLTQREPMWCGLVRDESAEDLHRGPDAESLPRGEALAAAREAVASYLAGHRAAVRPEQVFFAPSRSDARRLAIAATTGPGEKVLVPAPARPFLEATADSPRFTPYRLEFEEEWRIDRRSLRRAVGSSTRALVVGNPAEPTGAMLTPEEYAGIEELCAVRGIAVIADESFIDSAVRATVSVARAERVLAIHVSGLAGICGLPGAAWIALAGPPELTATAAERLELLAAPDREVTTSALRSIPTQLARREPYLAALRARLAGNRGAIAHASLREAPWSLLWGGGGPWAVLQINASRDDRELCLELLDEGVAVLPGSLEGLPRTGHVVVSLLTAPGVLDGGLQALERHLRGGE